MRPRPRPNRRRGLIRAGIAIVVLIALLVAALLIVSSLLAPKVQAPTAPLTPGPLTPGPLTPVLTPGTPATTPGTVRPGATPVTTSGTVTAPTAPPTPGKTRVKKLSLAPPRANAQVSASRFLSQIQPPSTPTPAVRKWTALFVGGGDAYSGRNLLVRPAGQRVGGQIVAKADPFVQPVWNRKQSSLYFVRPHQFSGIPGEKWTLYRWDLGSGKTHALLTQRALGLIPLGVRNGHLEYVLSRAADSVVNMIYHGKVQYLFILVTQPVSSAFLAPNDSGIAFSAPASCNFCTVDIYDLYNLYIWYGPSGAPSDLDIAWFADGMGLVTYDKSRHLVAVTNQGKVSGSYEVPARLPKRWVHPMTATVADSAVRLRDTVTGTVYIAPQVRD